jgi:hypothetical protein
MKGQGIMVMEYKGEESTLGLATLGWGVPGKEYSWGECLGWFVTTLCSCLAIQTLTWQCQQM